LDNNVNVVFVASEFSVEKEKRERGKSFSLERKKEKKYLKRRLNATGRKEDDAIIKIRRKTIRTYDSSVLVLGKGENIKFAISPHPLVACMIKISITEADTKDSLRRVFLSFVRSSL
jgi:hypothetical protein